MDHTSKNVTQAKRWHSVKSNPITSALMGAWGRHHVVNQVSTWAFCAATGRCGTNTLAEMLAVHPDIKAFHEPFPQPSFEILKRHGTDDNSIMAQYWHREKFPRVAYAARGGKAYLETSHLFIHTFAEQAWETVGQRMKVIHLHRDVHDTARSFLQRGQDPANDPWLIHPNSKKVLLNVNEAVSAGGEFDDPYLRLVWYCHEIRAQAQNFKQQHPEIDLLDIATEDLNSPDVIAQLLRDLDLSIDTAVLEKCGQRYNASRSKPEAPTSLDQGKLAAFEALLADRYGAANLAAPAGLA